MGVKEMQVLFDNPYATYYAGNQVSGRLLLTLDSPKKVREIKVKFKGQAAVKWSEHETRRDAEGKSVSEQVDYTAEELYFENKYSLAGESEIPRGTHNFNFVTILPSTLPSSYEGEFGHIRYTVKVTLDRPWKFDQECKAAFTVISPVDLNYMHEAQTPLRVAKEKSVGMLCCKSGPLSVVLSSPLSGYTPGQKIPITVELENGTNTNVTGGSVALRKIVTYKSTRPRKSKKLEKVYIAKIPLSSVGAHGSNSWRNMIGVPPLPPTNNISCSIITIAYELKLEVSVSGMLYRGLTFEVPVIIGNVPLVKRPPSIPAAQTLPTPGWTPDSYQNYYPDLPPPTYEESTFGKAKTIQDKDDNEHTMGVGGWVPRYPTFDFTPSAPYAPQPN